MLTVHQLSHAFDLDPLFENVTFSVNRGERVGLIGSNGSGKTTLFRIVTGEITPTTGHVGHAAGLRIGYLPQGFELNPDQTLGETLDAAIGNVDALEDELTELAIALGGNPTDAVLQEQYDEVLRRMSSAETSHAASIVASLGLDQLNPNLPTRILSGGQKTRLALALILLDSPDLMLLDEPTNHLDIAMLEWLEMWLATFAGGVLLISHDRTFLNRTTTKILALDKDKKQIVEYASNYDAYLQQWQTQQDKLRAAWSDQVYEERRLRQDAQNERARADKIHRTTTPRQPGLRKKAKKSMQRAKSKEKRIERYLNDSERVEKPQRGWQMQVEFAPSQHLGKSVLHLENLVIGYDKPLLTISERHVQAGQHIVLTGANGSGKTTLMRTLMERQPPLAGTFRWGASTEVGYMSQEQVLLDLNASPLDTMLGAGFANATDARTYLHKYLFAGDESIKPNSFLSYGQRSRLELALLVAKGCNVLLLDEPINHLDIPSRELFEHALSQFAGTIIAVIHDRMFIERFASEVWWLEEGQIRRQLN